VGRDELGEKLSFGSYLAKLEQVEISGMKQRFCIP